MIFLKKELKTVQHLKNLVDCYEYLIDHENGYYVEDYFHEMLSLERKRTQRSRKPFILLLINIHNLLGDLEKSEILKKVSSVLSAFPRETDIKGWYKYEDIIGVIFTEISGNGQEIIKKKINDELYYELGSELIDKIDVTFHVYPEEEEKSKQDKSEFDLNLYSDLTRKNAPSIKKNSSEISLSLKRVIDIVGSIFGIILFSPIFIFVSVLIKLTSPGPVLFRQVRMGRCGAKFSFLKFRTMYINNSDSSHQKYIEEFILNQKSSCSDKSNGGNGTVYKMCNDNRITPLGRFLRKTSLDELPQFFNVLQGEMSLVGPRPPIPYELEHYDIWHRRRVLEIKPGITGLWQTRGRSSTTFDEMVRMDIKYIKERSLLLDIKLLLLTPWVVVTGKGAL